MSRIEAAKAAANHELRDAHSAAIKHLQDAGLEMRDAIETMTLGYLQLAVLNSLSGARATGDNLDEVRQTLLDDAAKVFDEFKERLTRDN